MLISIITPVYNRQDCIVRCIKSVQEQQYNNYEHIIIDDGSQDNTKTLIEAFTLNDSRISLISYKDNKGVNFARNRGIEHAKGNYICFLDSDDYLKIGSLNLIENYINKNSNIKHFIFNVSDRKCDIKLPQSDTKYYYRNFLRGDINGDFTHIVLSDICKKNLFPEEFRAMENLNWLRIFKLSEPLLFVNKIVAQIERQRNDGLTSELRLINKNAITQQFLFLVKFINQYSEDYKIYNKKYLYNIVFKCLFIGILLNNNDQIKLILNTFKYIRFIKPIYMIFVKLYTGKLLMPIFLIIMRARHNLKTKYVLNK